MSPSSVEFRSSVYATEKLLRLRIRLSADQADIEQPRQGFTPVMAIFIFYLPFQTGLHPLNNSSGPYKIQVCSGNVEPGVVGIVRILIHFGYEAPNDL